MLGDPLPTDNDLGQSIYDFKYRVFPSDLGEASYNGHYMVININVQNATEYEGSISTPTGNQNTFHSFPGVSAPRSATVFGQLSKTDALRGTIDPKFTSASGSGLGYGSLFLPRFTRRIKESIAIYTPNTLQFDTNNEYEEVKLTNMVMGGISSLTGLGKSKLGKALGSAVDTAGGLIDKTSKLFQSPINPRAEVLFSTTTQRVFQYDFLFAPENEKETNTVKEIIRTLRFHAAPEIGGDTGIFFTPPSEFDITFFYRGQENLSIPRINTCVLTAISVDYAPSGTFSSFTNGAPVSIRMQLQLREVEVQNKLRIIQGF